MRHPKSDRRNVSDNAMRGSSGSDLTMPLLQRDKKPVQIVKQSRFTSGEGSDLSMIESAMNLGGYRDTWSEGNTSLQELARIEMQVRPVPGVRYGDL